MCISQRINQGRRIAEQAQGALFTHYGISGPGIMDMSKRIVECLPKVSVQIRIDFKPRHTPEELDTILLSQMKRHGSKAMKSCLTFSSGEISPVLLNLCNIDPQKGIPNNDV
ncbi:MAG: NAD(P)/FAD-dependent oxidoreductase [Planctomycetia bacterium]|nr:NAD(P)/FAD-dependent oxidoreductase [Planctomycetia bacterium]